MSEHRPECIYTPEHFDPEQNIVWGGKPCICEEIKRAEKRVLDALDLASANVKYQSIGFAAGLDAAREAVAALHQRIPVIECPCGWGKDCPECGSESNRIVGYVCDACCNSFGDHAYCDDLHYEDDTPLHHQDGQMWSGPHCPTLASIDALRRESDV